MDDRRVGQILREVRIHHGWRQADLSERSGVGRAQISEAELGRIDRVSLRSLRRLGDALDIRVSVALWWRAGQIDRLLDRAHAAIVEHVVQSLRSDEYDVRVEYTFSEFGERGSVDVLGWRAADRTLAIGEIKSRIDDVQATNAAFGRKARLVPAIVRRDEGWDPARVVTLLALPDTRQNRDVVRRHAGTFAATWPLGTAAIRRLLAGRGSASIQARGGIWFVPTRRLASAARTVARVRPNRPAAR